MRCLQPPVFACISHVWRAIYLPRDVLQQPVVAFPDKRDWGAVGEERRGGAGEKVRAEGGGRGHNAVVRLRPGDPAPGGPPLGPLRRPVERNGGPVKARSLRRRNRAPGLQAYGNAARQVVDGLRTEVCGQQQSNDPRNNPNTPTTGRR